MTQARPKSSLENDLRELAAEASASCDLELVETHVRRVGRKWRIRVDIDRPGPAGVGLADCERVSHELGRRIEERDVVPDSYLLEVSSPGLDRPIRTDADLRRNTGRQVVVETVADTGEGVQVRGVLVGADQEVLTVREEGGAERRVPRSSVVSVRQEIAFE